MEKRSDQQTRADSKTQLVAQINSCLHSGDYSRSLDLLRSASAKFPNDAELSELEKLAQDGVKHKAEADRLITESQELFAQQKAAEAIQLLREAYKLDENNSLARTILANALVEHAQSIVGTDWREAETLAKQALDLNPAHPTAKTISSLILDQKKTSFVEECVAQARKFQSSGNMAAALSQIAKGLAVYPRDPMLVQIQDGIQRDQGAQRRQARRRDLEDLRGMDSDIDVVADLASKQGLSERIHAVTAKYSTDGEILSVANGLLRRLELIEVPEGSSTASPDAATATVNDPAPPPSAPEASAAAISEIPPTNDSPSIGPADTVPALPPEPPPAPAPAVVPAADTSLPAVEVTSSSSEPTPPTKSRSTTLILVSAAVIILVAATFFFTRKHYAEPEAKAPLTAPIVSAPAASAPTVAPPVVSAPAPATPEPSPPASSPSPATTAGNVTPDDRLPAESGHNLGTLLVVAGQDDAKVFLNGKAQPQLTQSGQLRLLNLELKDYVVQVSKSGFQDPPQQKIRVRKGEQARLVFKLQPKPRVNTQPPPQPPPRLASLTIQGGAPGTTVLVDQALVGTVQPDGTLSVSNVNPGDHTIELRKERFKPRQLKKSFIAGATLSLAAADAALEAASEARPESTTGLLKITFAPADATVAIVKGDLLKMVSSGAPLNLAPGTYTLTARTAERFTRSSTLEVVAGQSKALDLSLAPTGMSKWDDPGAWKHEKDSFTRKGGDFVLYGVAPASGTFVFSAMPAKSHVLQWVVNYTDPKNYILFQVDDTTFSRTVIRNGEKTNEIKVPDKGDKKSFRMLQIRVSATEIVHQIKHGESWTVLDRWAGFGSNLSLGKFGFYLPGNDQVELSNFAHYADLNIR